MYKRRTTTAHVRVRWVEAGRVTYYGRTSGTKETDFRGDMQMVSDGASKDVFGLYELADDGTILYSRLRTGEELKGPEHQIVGKDFFRDIARFENTDDLRRHFKSFIKGDRPADTFVFDCLFQTEVVRAKVFMTRAYEVDYGHSGGIVIMDIRKAGQ